MSRIDKFEEILESYDGRKYKPDYLPSVEDLKLIHRILTQDHDCFAKIAYIACKQDVFQDIHCPATLYMDGPQRPIISDGDRQAALNQIREKDLDFAGVVHYIAENNLIDFKQEEKPDDRQYVPDGVEMPDLLLILNKTGQYVIFKDRKLYDLGIGIGT